MDNQKIVDGLKVYLEAAKTNLAEYKRLGDEKAIRIGEEMVKDFERQISLYQEV
jgi:hypothetical protein